MDLAGPRIERLPDDLVNQIAAGEVVERPASVVKELLENALDAGARSVRVDMEGGGRTLLRVADDGHGMGREDAERALERYATSKLRRWEDLQSLRTHGFRGEALPAISSVSHLILRTRDEGGPAGTEVEVRDGRLLHVRDAGHPRGTTVEVRDLFAGVPARRKFLRADPTEAAHVAEAVTLLALSRPDTGFHLSSSGRTLLQAPPVGGLAERLYQLFGNEWFKDLLPVEGGTDWAWVRGFVARPDRGGPGRPTLRLFVNGRAVRDRALAKAVAEGYRGAGAREPRGDAVLFLEVPLHLVDVNVHPAKAEVRFADARTAFTAVESAVREALGRGARERPPRPDAIRLDGGEEGFLGGGAGRVAEERGAVLPLSPPPPADSLLPAGVPTVLGQHRNTYILASDGEDLLLVDQHTAQERARFEILMEGLARGAVESQILLTPLVFNLEPGLQPVLEANALELAELGYEMDAFGGESLRLRAVPAALPAGDPVRALEAILSDLKDRESAEWAVSGSRSRLAATLACHSSARAGQPLSAEAMKAILGQLWRAAHPTLCPHGRPTLVRIPRADVTRWFRRTGWRRQ